MHARKAHKSQSSLSWKFQRAQSAQVAKFFVVEVSTRAQRTSRKVLCRGSFNAHKCARFFCRGAFNAPAALAAALALTLTQRRFSTAPRPHQPATPWPRPRRRARGRATSGADASPTRGCDGPYTRARAWHAERANWRKSTLRACFLARFDAELTASPPARPRRSLRRCPRSRDRRSTRPRGATWRATPHANVSVLRAQRPAARDPPTPPKSAPPAPPASRAPASRPDFRADFADLSELCESKGVPSC